MTRPAHVGIDLGTTNSLVAVINEHGRPEVLPNAEGERLTPSVVAFEGESDEPLVGREAKEWARVGVDEVASFFKPFMGNPDFRMSLRGRELDAAQLSALVLRKLKRDAETALGRPVDRAVVTVPAYFADPQRKATIRAGELAGLRVTRVLNEPTAAALAYGLRDADSDETILIYDLGGGTFDVTVARIAPGELEVLATAGDHDLGGKNWDDRVATWLAERFAADTGVDPLDDPLALNDVLLRAEQAKWTLSERNSARISLQVGPHRRSYDLARAEFENLTFPLMDRTRTLVEEALHAADLDWSRIGGVLLVGGSTRMPMVREYVARMAGKPPQAGVNVDEVVALGAALQAAIDDGEIPANATADALPRFRLPGARAVRDVMSHSLGAVAVSSDGSKYVNDVIIPRNTPVPAENVRSYAYAPKPAGNDRIEVYLAQGESERPLDCQILGKYVFENIRPTAPEIVADVRLSYDRDGVVQVRANQRDTGHPLALRVEPVPDDLAWLDLPPAPDASRETQPPLAILLLVDVSSSMAGPPLDEAKQAAAAFLHQCDFTRAEVGLVAFSNEAVLQTPLTNNARKVHAGIARLEAEGTTNLADALELARTHLQARNPAPPPETLDFVVILTDGYPDAPAATKQQADILKSQNIEIVAIGTGEADQPYLETLASATAGAIFARKGQLVQTFNHIAKVINTQAKSLRRLA